MKSLVLALFMLLATVSSAHAAHPSSNLGLGLIIGEPTGLEARWSVAPEREIHGILAFSFSDFVMLAGDYVFEFPGASWLPAQARSQLTPYIGLGGVLLFSNGHRFGNDRKYFTSNDSVGLGIRIPVGMEWHIPRSPIGLFAELVPGIGIVPGTYGFFQGGIGAVFYF